MGVIDNNFVLARSKEHKYILETLGELEATLRLATSEELVPKLKNIIEPFKEHVEQHQGLEEEVIFLAAAETMPMKKILKTILRLQREHGVISTTVDSVIFKLYNLNIDDNMRLKICNELNHLILLIKRHSLVEVKELFPVICGNFRCKQLIDQYSAEQKV